ncbi:MAG: DUF4398 domain-containing protein [Bacteroidota bacterium]
MIVLMLLVGCGSSAPPPDAELAEARSFIAQAEESGSAEYAPLQLRNARQKAERAEALMREGENEEARRLAEQALVDAELAEAVAASEKAKAAVEEVRASIETLRQEIERNRTRSGG